MRIAILFVAALFSVVASVRAADESSPNIVLIVADDLGYGELGCYGQEKIRTPRLDELASEGMRFTQFYSGSPVCAPSRSVLMTGQHAGHTFVRNNRDHRKRNPHHEGQIAIPDETVTLAERLRSLGYATGAFGKWGLGGPGTEGAPERQGFDRFFGYICQWQAHNYHPTHLWRNDEKVPLRNPEFSPHQKIAEPPASPDGYDQYRGPDYACDLITDEALRFIDEHADTPFFLYVPTPVPHVAIQVPDDSLADYAELGWDSKAYLGEKGYLPHPAPRAAYAAMISRMDRDLGRIFDRLEQRGVADNTIVIFTSDNGPTYAGGVDHAFFNSAGGLRGLKGSVYEGGLRVPTIVRWPGRVHPGSTTHQVAGFQDLVPTLMDLAGGEIPDDIDGVTILPALLGRVGEQPARTPMYWELGAQQAIRIGDWKLVRRWDRKTKTVRNTQLFNLADDRNETDNLADERPDIRDHLIEAMRRHRTPSVDFPAPWDE